MSMTRDPARHRQPHPKQRPPSHPRLASLGTFKPWTHWECQSWKVVPSQGVPRENARTSQSCAIASLSKGSHCSHERYSGDLGPSSAHPTIFHLPPRSPSGTSDPSLKQGSMSDRTPASKRPGKTGSKRSLVERVEGQVLRANKALERRDGATRPKIRRRSKPRGAAAQPGATLATNGDTPVPGATPNVPL